VNAPTRSGPGVLDPVRLRARRFGAAAGVALLLGLLAAACAHLDPGRDDGWHPLARSSDSPWIVGRMQRHRIVGEETLLDLTRRYDLGYVELVAANPGVDPWLPGVGTEVVLPTAHLVPASEDVSAETPDRRGLLVNLAEQRLYAFTAEDEAATSVASFPIGVSREGFATPLGRTRVVRKREAPTWYPPASARRDDPSLPAAVQAGPENPLGEFALYLAWPRYLIHGTNEPDGVGRRVSRGCIRLYPEDISRLYESTPVDAPVEVIHEPVKIVRTGDEVYLEVHPTLDEMAELEEAGRLEPIRPADLRPRIRRVAAEAAARVDWRLAYRTAAERRGVPVRITR